MKPTTKDYPYRCLCCGEPIGGGDACAKCYDRNAPCCIKLKEKWKLNR